jgi:serine/threonine-protein kinase HipA
MPAPLNKAQVFYGRRFAGTLECHDQAFDFFYDSAYRADPDARPVAPALPLEMAHHRTASLQAWFEVVPEGWLLNQISAGQSLNLSDQFQLLLHWCQQALGPISLQAGAPVPLA